MTRKLLAVLTVIPLLLLGLQACSSDESGTESSPPGAVDDTGVKTDTSGDEDKTDTGGEGEADPGTAENPEDAKTPDPKEDTGGETPKEDTTGTTIEPPPPVEVCEDAASIDAAGVIANNPVQRVNALGIGGWGEKMVCDATTARDVDDDPETSFPNTGSDFDCTGGLNNGLLAIIDLAAGFMSGGSISDTIAEALNGGDINILVEFVDYKNDGSEFDINFYNAKPAKDNEVTEEEVEGKKTFTWSKCDIGSSEAAPCEYLIDAQSYNKDCVTPLISFTGAKVEEGKITVGGVDQIFELAIPIDAETIIPIRVTAVTITATVVEAEGKVAELQDGLLTGIIPQNVLLGIVNDVLGGSGVGGIDPELIASMLPSFMDIDTDDDGSTDALSVGLNLATIPGTVTGVFIEEEGGEGGEGGEGTE